MPVRGPPRFIAVSAFLLFLTAPLPAQTPAPATTQPATAIPSLRAERRDGPIVLDAKLDEPAWQKAPPATEFTQSYPNARQTPTQRTEVRVLYDDDALYVGVKMFDTHPDSIVGLHRDDRRRRFRPRRLQLKTLAPNEVLELTHTWDQRSQRGEPVPPGRYRVRANILTDGQTELASNEAMLLITGD